MSASPARLSVAFGKTFTLVIREQDMELSFRSDEALKAAGETMTADQYFKKHLRGKARYRVSMTHGRHRKEVYSPTYKRVNRHAANDALNLTLASAATAIALRFNS